MLVNHMAKRHPNISISSIHELNLPILKTERCFYCQYCDKVYKSSSKRKAHILKYHPGEALPQSTRNENDEYDSSDLPNASFSRNIGSITLNPFQCDWCYKQYASHTRLLQHRRKEHSNEIQTTYKVNEYFRDHFEMSYQSNNTENHTNIADYAIYNGIHDNNHRHNSHRFNNIEYEPENKLLKLSSAALEASIRDEFSFLNEDDDISSRVNEHPQVSEANNSNLSKVGINFKVVGDEFTDASANSNSDLNTLPQLFEEIDCMSLKSTHFTSSNNNSTRDSQIQTLQ